MKIVGVPLTSAAGLHADPDRSLLNLEPVMSLTVTGHVQSQVDGDLVDLFGVQVAEIGGYFVMKFPEAPLAFGRERRFDRQQRHAVGADGKGFVNDLDGVRIFFEHLLE